MFRYESEECITIMKQKKSLNEVIYLPEYYAGKFSQLLQKEKTSEILYWDFTKNVSEIVKLQIENLLTFIVCAEHVTNLTGESPVTGIYRQV